MEVPSHLAINWAAIWFVDRRLELWATQTVLALISLSEALLLAYLTYKVSQRRAVTEPGPIGNRISYPKLMNVLLALSKRLAVP